MKIKWLFIFTVLILLIILILRFGVNHKGEPVSGDIITIAGNGSEGFSGDDGPATLAELGFPDDVVLDTAGNLFISDQSNNRIRKVDPQGNIATVAGNGSKGYAGDGGPAVSAELSNPSAVALDNLGNLYISDLANMRIRKISKSGVISTVAGGGSMMNKSGLATRALLPIPGGIVLDSKGSLYIAESTFEGI